MKEKDAGLDELHDSRDKSQVCERLAIETILSLMKTS